MGADAAVLFQLEGMKQQTHHLVFVIVKAKEGADPDVVNPRLLGAVHRHYTPSEIGFWPGRVHLSVGLMVVCFLEKDIGSDLRSFKPLEFRDGQWCNFGVDPADLPPPSVLTA